MKKILITSFILFALFISPFQKVSATEMNRVMSIAQALLFTGLNVLLVDSGSIKLNGLYAMNSEGNTITGEVTVIPTKDLFGTGLEYHTSLSLYKGYQTNFTVWTNELFYDAFLLSNLQVGVGVSLWGVTSSVVPMLSLNYKILENVTVSYGLGVASLLTHTIKAGTVFNF
jgi:hypothetical protein